MLFLKRVVIWATILTVIALGFALYRDISAGTRPALVGTLVFAIVVWILAAAFVTLTKILGAAGTFGASLGRAVVKNPRQGAGAAIGSAAQKALDQEGLTSANTSVKH